MYEVPRVVKLIETESRMVVGGVWGNGELLRVSVLQDERISVGR